MTYGLVTWASGGDHRLAILVTGTFFVAGIVIVAAVDVERGRRGALQSSPLSSAHAGRPSERGQPDACYPCRGRLMLLKSPLLRYCRKFVPFFTETAWR